jgi:hypothetical protein
VSVSPPPGGVVVGGRVVVDDDGGVLPAGVMAVGEVRPACAK